MARTSEGFCFLLTEKSCFLADTRFCGNTLRFSCNNNMVFFLPARNYYLLRHLQPYKYAFRKELLTKRMENRVCFVVLPKRLDMSLQRPLLHHVDQTPDQRCRVQLSHFKRSPRDFQTLVGFSCLMHLYLATVIIATTLLPCSSHVTAAATVVDGYYLSALSQ